MMQKISVRVRSADTKKRQRIGTFYWIKQKDSPLKLIDFNGKF